MNASVTGFNTGSSFEDVYLLDGLRTPFGKFCGSLSTISPTDLGILSSKGVIAKAGIPVKDIDQTIVSNIGQASADSFFLPRHIALYSGLRLETPSVLVQRICGSGIEVLGQAAEQIGMGKSNVVLGCGADTMSLYPLVSFNGRQGFKLGRPGFIDMLWEALNDTAAVPMGHTADNLAKKYNLKRVEVDAFSKRSQDRYLKAFKSGFFTDEIIAIDKKGVHEREGLKPRTYRLNGGETLNMDEHPRGADMAKLAALPFVFTKEGPTTAGSASGIVDGAASVIIASGDYVRSNGLKPLGKIRAYAAVGVDPNYMGIGPVPAIQSVLNVLKLKIRDIDLFEINEAFSAQCMSVAQELELDQERLNVNGGAIAIGHPLAASGVRLAITCLRGLKKNGGTLGIASACIGGGQGIAMVLESVNLK